MRGIAILKKRGGMLIQRESREGGKTKPRRISVGKKEKQTENPFKAIGEERRSAGRKRGFSGERPPILEAGAPNEVYDPLAKKETSSPSPKRRLWGKKVDNLK